MKKNWLMVAVVLIAGAAASAQAQVERAAKWEALPETICSVFIGPEDRRWYVEQIGEVKPTDVEAVKRCIASEWAKSAPVLKDCWPMLFEKGGAVWFVTRDRRMLLRYDGAKWIAQATHAPADVKGGFVGVCPGRSRGRTSGYNREVGDIRVFVESTGVSAFDGKAWAFQALSNSAKGNYDAVRVLAEKDGRGVLVLQMSPSVLWRFRDGKWSRVVLPMEGLSGRESARPTISSAVVMPDGGVWVKQPSGLSHIPLKTDVKREPEDAVSDKFVWASVQGRDVSAYVTGLEQDAWGNVYVGFYNVPRELLPEMSGMVIVAPDGTSKFFSGEIGMRAMFAGQTPLRDGNGNWWYGSFLGSEWVQCFAANAETWTQAKYTLTGMQFVQAIAADGTVYASYSDPLGWPSGEPHMQGVVAFRPDGLEKRRVVKLDEVEIADSIAAVSDDGAVLAAVVGKGLCRYDGQGFEPVKVQGAAGGVVIPGRGGIILRWVRPGTRNLDYFSISDGKKTVESADIAGLIQGNRKMFVKAFGGGGDPATWAEAQQRMGGLNYATGEWIQGGWSIAVDKQDRVWLAFQGKLRVLDKGGRWIDVNWTVPPGSTMSGGFKLETGGTGPTMVLPLGDRETMYVTNSAGLNSDETKRKGYVVKLEGDKTSMKETPAPRGPVWRKANGDLVVVWQRELKVKPGESWKHEIVATIVGADGAGDEWVLPGVPVLMDKSDYLWLSDEIDTVRHGARFTLWKDGVVAGHAYVPGLCEGIVSDGVGSVWVAASGGLHHLVAEDARKLAEYRVKEVCVMMSKEGEVSRLEQAKGLTVCKEGIMVKWWTAGDPYSRHWVGVLPVVR